VTPKKTTQPINTRRAPHFKKTEREWRQGPLTGQQEVNDLVLLDGDGVQVDLLDGVDDAGLDQTAELGHGDPLLLIATATGTGTATATATAATTTTATTAKPTTTLTTGSTSASVSHA
jgi:hypothetical protein